MEPTETGSLGGSRQVPPVAVKHPLKAEVKAGQTYYWCACGLSAREPFCDGSHKTTSFLPVAHKAEKDGTVYFCGCKQTHTPPLCDGAHKTL